MAKNKLIRKSFLFSEISLNLFWYLIWSRFFGYKVYVFDNSNRRIQFMLLQKLHKQGLIIRVTEHNSVPFFRAHTDAIEMANNIINNKNKDTSMHLARMLFENYETDLVFKRILASHLHLLISINQYVINNIKIDSASVFINKKYKKIIDENAGIIDESIHIKYTFNFSIFKLRLLWLNLILGYLLHLLLQPFYKQKKSQEVLNYAISVPYPWALKFKGAREFTFLVDNKNIKKNEVVFFIEFKETRAFYHHYSSRGFFLEEAKVTFNLLDLFKSSNLKIQKDFFIIAKLFFCYKKVFFIYEALFSLLISRISWGIIIKKTPIKNYIYFNKEGPSQISTNVFLKSLGIKTHAYTQFVGGTYQISGENSIFDKRNILWSFLNPNYYYLNNQAMIDSMKLHFQTNVLYKNIGNIFSEKILEIKKDSSRINSLKKHYRTLGFSKVIVIFDTTYIPLNSLYSTYDEAQSFLKDMISLAQSLPNCLFLFKPSKNDNYFLTKKRYWAHESGAEIVALRHVFAKLPNTLMLSDFDDVIDIISLGDIILTNCFSSPSVDALLANIPAFWYQSKTDVSFSIYNKIPNLIVNGYTELVENIHKIFKNGYPQVFKNNADFNHLIGNRNKKALTDLRLNIVNSKK